MGHACRDHQIYKRGRENQVRYRVRFFSALGLAVVVSAVFLVWRTQKNGDVPLSPLVSPLPRPTIFIASPLSPPTLTPAHVPHAVPPTGTPAVNTATLQAMRTARPTATPPSPSGTRWPYISPETWRRWALRILAAAAVLAYVGLRLRESVGKAGSK
jgi:hypothetical protein